MELTESKALLEKIDNFFADLLVLNQNQVTIHEKYDVSIEKCGLFVIVKNNNTGNSYSLRSESSFVENEIMTMVWVVLKDQSEIPVMLIELDVIWINPKKLVQEFNDILTKLFTIRKINKYLKNIVYKESKRLSRAT